VRFAPYPRAEADSIAASTPSDAPSARPTRALCSSSPSSAAAAASSHPIASSPALAELCRDKGALLIADEIWTGLGRAGSMVRSTTLGVNADILCFGKGLGGGLPISACVAPDAIMAAWADAQHGEVVHTSTHAGSPLACATAIATLDALRFRRLVIRSRELGVTAIEAFRKALEGLPAVVEVRGAGLMIGVELQSAELALRATSGMLSRGYLVLTGGTRGEVLTLTPALTIGEERLLEAASALRDVLSAA
jgi:4-aminobutyrate aminotransferase/(S)-3-amino-2-methylpropionate transaminase